MRLRRWFARNAGRCAHGTIMRRNASGGILNVMQFLTVIKGAGAALPLSPARSQNACAHRGLNQDRILHCTLRRSLCN